MGQKINPLAFRISNSRNWLSEWYADKKNYANNVLEDSEIRSYLDQYKKQYRISRVKIEKILDTLNVIIYTSKPASILSKDDLMKKIKFDLDLISQNVFKFNSGTTEKKNISLSVLSTKHPNLDSDIIGLTVVDNIEKRYSYKKAIKSVIDSSMKAGAKGVKIKISGRINGSEIARSESFLQGSVPLQTISNDIQFTRITARTPYGAIGIKVWINKSKHRN